MKAFKDYEKTQAYTDGERLPSGYYIGVIKNAEEVQNRNGGSRLEIAVEITEGEYRDYFTNDYRAQTRENKRWRGVLPLFVPTDDGSERDGWTKRAFKTAITAIEESNNGYHWDWNEKALKGLKIGFAVRREEYEPDKWATKVFRLVSLDAINGGKLKPVEDKPMKGSTSSAPVSAANNGDFVPVDDGDDLPF